MSFSSNLPTFIRTPRQASDIYSQSLAFPKQRNVFFVRFYGARASGIHPSQLSLTYTVKTIDRPGIQPVTEEINQYNKKRQVYTGYKKSPVKCSFYDDASGSAQKMWAEYSSYYFGDFAQGNQDHAFTDDINGQWQPGSGGGFGFTAINGGNPGANSQWFFVRIDIFHLHNQIFDLYSLINPRITSFAPDELDYEQSGIAMINAEFAYDAMVFTPNFDYPAKNLDEFATGLFNGETDGTIADANVPPATGTNPAPYSEGASGTFAGIEQLFGGSGPGIAGSAVPDYRYLSGAAGSGLSLFGSFAFGKNGGNQIGIGLSPNGSQLSYRSTNNPALAAVLGVATNPLAVNTALGVYGTTAGYQGMPPGYPGVVAGVGAGMTSYGPAQQIAQGVMVDGLSGGQGYSMSSRGMALTPEAYGAINASRSGATQYGYNPSTTPSGALYGPQGPGGVTAPIGLSDAPVQAPQSYGDITQYGGEAATWDTPTAPPVPDAVITATVLPTAPAPSNPNQGTDYGSWDNPPDPNSGIAVDDSTA